MRITRKSAITGIERSLYVPVNPEDYVMWQNGLGSIEDLMPYLNVADKDYILSGIIPAEWKEAFAEVE